MAFQFVEPDKYEFIDEEGESFVVAYIGSDANTDCAYYAAAALSPYDDHMEYSFFIIQRCNGQERQFTSGLETKDIFEEDGSSGHLNGCTDGDRIPTLTKTSRP